MQSAAATGELELAMQALESFGRLRLKVRGTSMMPTLLPGDVLSFEACTAEALGAGEIVLFRRDQGLVIHRVLSATGAGLLTQGDGLVRPDPEVNALDVLGKVVAVERSNRRMPAPRRIGDWRLRSGRMLFGRSTIAVRLYLRWWRLSTWLAT